MKDTLSDFMVQSISLTISSHYDINDDSISISTWVESHIGLTKNWYFVFPNISHCDSNGLVIKLFHGCTVTWDASKLRHASSKVSYLRLRGGGAKPKSSGSCSLRKKKRQRKDLEFCNFSVEILSLIDLLQIFRQQQTFSANNIS